MRTLFLALTCGLLLACGSRGGNTTSQPDAGQGADSQEPPPVDGGSPLPDGTSPPSDAGIATPDVWQPTGDGGPFGTIIQLSVGYTHACVLESGGRIACWGVNQYGQIDTPPGTYSYVTAGDAYTCALHTDGTAVCWGEQGLYDVTPPAGLAFTKISAGAADPGG